MPLSDDAARRYARHLTLPEIGISGQQQLAAARVLVVGAGGLGAATIAYLSAAGVGTLGIADNDHVELSNLQRQIIHETADIGRLKTESARDRAEELNPHTHVVTHTERVTDANARTLIASYDIVADCSDNFSTRFAVSAACHALGKPVVSAAIRGFEWQISTFKSHLGAPHPCYRCLVPDHPQADRQCQQEGVLGPLCGMAGSLQAVEVIKELLGIGESLSGKLLRYNALSVQLRKTTLLRDPACTTCGLRGAQSAA